MDPGYLRHKLPVNTSIGNWEFVRRSRARGRHPLLVAGCVLMMRGILVVFR